jgi:hypothetical protein
MNGHVNKRTSIVLHIYKLWYTVLEVWMISEFQNLNTKCKDIEKRKILVKKYARDFYKKCRYKQN